MRGRLCLDYGCAVNNMSIIRIHILCASASSRGSADPLIKSCRVSRRMVKQQKCVTLCLVDKLVSRVQLALLSDLQLTSWTRWLPCLSHCLSVWE